MAGKYKTTDEMAEEFIEMLDSVSSIDDLRAHGVPDKTIEKFEGIMRREGLDPKRPEDVREVFEVMLEIAGKRKGPQPN